MSNESQNVEALCDIEAGCGAIDQLVYPKDKDLGGFTVRRALPNQALKSVGPWIFFDHMGPARFPAGEGVNVRPHPHINISTVTYLFAGEILHRDSIGSVQAIKPGDLNLMVTGSGMVHSEREPDEVRNSVHSVHGLQLWLALPEAHEETEPAFYHYPAAILPKLSTDGVAVSVMIGTAYGVTSPTKTFSSTLYIEAKLNAGQSLTLPTADERALYVVSGEIALKDALVKNHTMVVLSAAEGIVIKAKTASQIALIGGSNVGHRYIDWNFVSSKQARIDSAKQQWIAREFPSVPGDDKEYIPYPSLPKS